jgi:hypothetical protein
MPALLGGYGHMAEYPIAGLYADGRWQKTCELISRKL